MPLLSYLHQQFPPMAPMSYVTMMSEESAGDLTSIWLWCRYQSDQTSLQAGPKIRLRRHRGTHRPWRMAIAKWFSWPLRQM